MSNQLQVAMIETILSLRQRGWSQRRIARELGIDRQTVARYLHQQATRAKPAIAPLGSADASHEPKPAIAPLGSPPADESANPAIAPLGSTPLANPADQEPLTETEQVSRAGRASDCLPWRALILTKLESGLSAQRIYQDLTAEHGFTGT